VKPLSDEDKKKATSDRQQKEVAAKA
jgi:hypothetical protein